MRAHCRLCHVTRSGVLRRERARALAAVGPRRLLRVASALGCVGVWLPAVGMCVGGWAGVSASCRREWNRVNVAHCRADRRVWTTRASLRACARRFVCSVWCGRPGARGSAGSYGGTPSSTARFVLRPALCPLRARNHRTCCVVPPPVPRAAVVPPAAGACLLRFALSRCAVPFDARASRHTLRAPRARLCSLPSRAALALGSVPAARGRVPHLESRVRTPGCPPPTTHPQPTHSPQLLTWTRLQTRWLASCVRRDRTRCGRCRCQTLLRLS